MQENSGEQLLIKKLDHNRGLHAKNQREISSNKVRTLHWPLGGRKCGKGGKWYKDRGKWIIESRIEFPDPMLMTLDRGKIIFSPLWVLISFILVENKARTLSPRVLLTAAPLSSYIRQVFITA